MPNFTTTNSTAPPPYPAAHPHSSDMSPLTAVLCLVALITIPTITYTFFMALRCPRNPFRRSSAATTAESGCDKQKSEPVCGVRYRKSEAEGKDQCPVCLSEFVEGEEIRQLSACGHAFHGACVDAWLSSRASCPVCRASVPVKRSKPVFVDRRDDYRQGLPDAASLI